MPPGLRDILPAPLSCCEEPRKTVLPRVWLNRSSAVRRPPTAVSSGIYPGRRRAQRFENSRPEHGCVLLAPG